MSAVRSESPRAKSHPARFLIGGLLLVTLAISVAPVAYGRPTGKSISVVGRLPESPEPTLGTYLIDVDPDLQQMLYLSRRGSWFFLSEYDMTSEIPRLVRETRIGSYEEFGLDSASPYTISVDRRRSLAYFLGITYAGTVIRAIDLEGFKLAGTWDLSTSAPGFFGEGMSLSAADDRLYVVGGFYGEAHVKKGTDLSKPAVATGVIALELADGAEGAPSVAWLKPIPECQAPLITGSTGTLLARSTVQDALYFACVRSDPYPGQSGLVRLSIQPKAGPPEALGFETDFFPISGSYTRPPGRMLGAGAFDQRSDRYFMQSISPGTPGTWVFDGKLSAWVGFIAAPDNNNYYLGLDQSSGRFYMASEYTGFQSNSYLLVTDGRATPVPQGRIYQGFGTAGFIYPDPATGRLFVKMELSKLALGEEGLGYVVLHDRTPVPQRPVPLDFDALTRDLPEGPQTLTSYSGGVNGFGARALLIGGYGGVLSAGGTPIAVGQLRPGDRGVTAARIPGIDLREAGAAASAHAFVPDSNTDAELSDGGADQLPWNPVSCLDGSGDSISEQDSQQAGRATVDCDLKKGTATATAVYGELAAGTVSVARSSIVATARRDVKLGTVTDVIATASGIELPSSQGTLVIGKVSTEARTRAHGRPGTTKAKWRRVISGVEVRDAQGNVVQSLGQCDSEDKENQCGPLQDAINDLLPTRIRLDLPHADLKATPRGAFAGVQQSDGDFYDNRTVNNQGAVFDGEGGTRAVPAVQITVFNDTQEKSRLVLQLAAAQANSIYTISPRGVSDPTGGGPPIPFPAVGDGGGLGGAGGDTLLGKVTPPVVEEPAGADPVLAGSQPIAAPQPVEGVLAFLRRTPQEMVLVAMVWLLFGAAGWALFRRYNLLNVLGDAK